MKKRYGRWYKTIDFEKIQCELCPRLCVLKEGARGYCGVRSMQQGKIVSDAWARIVALNIDPIEKKPLYHYYPGQDILSLGTLGCNLRCQFCQNWSISCAKYDDSTTKEYSPEEIVDIAKTKCKMIAYTYNEPIVWGEYAVECAKLARKLGIKNIMVSAGFVCSEPRNEIFSHMDAANIDLKGFSEDFYKDFTGAQLGPVLETIEYLAQLKDFWLEITTLLIPGLNDSPEMLRQEFEWIAKHAGCHTPLHLSAFFPQHKMLDRDPTTLQSLQSAQKLALDIGLNYVYLGNVMHAAHTYCPQCENTLIERWRYDTIITGLNGANCKKCGRKLEGQFDDF
ncbi:MAG: AmmeMemoRadiSam system radical SAM enzyme [Bradymonadales bacterium]|jgi:pyruvate formate lyase activating enzyme